MHLPSNILAQPLSQVGKADLATAQFTDFAADITTFLWHSDIRLIGSWNGDQFRLYCRHIINSTRVSTSVVILALKYISRLKYQRNYSQPQFGTEYQVFTVALLLAKKFLEDQSLTIQYWSRQSSISVAELNLLEMEILKGTNYTLYVSQEEYFLWLKQLEYFIKLRQEYLELFEVQMVQLNDPRPLPSQMVTDERTHAAPIRATKSLHTARTYPLIS
ncbi:hypothetical protein K7432_006550 [Basidiobolus ranarum]|uniref:Cyclin n=1 Tax=Basidiobolus ranarum TaxID=34480 RepID=A0ABR2WUY1_9FUNG